MISEENYKVSVSLPGKEIEADINEELSDYSIDEPFEITEAMSKQAIRYFKWADMLRRAEKVVTILKREYDLWHARAIKKIREVLLSKEGNSKPTINDLTNGIKLYYGKSFGEWSNKLDKAQDSVNILGVVVKATMIKKDMLVSIGQLCSRLIDSSNLVVKDKRISQRRT